LRAAVFGRSVVSATGALGDGFGRPGRSIGRRTDMVEASRSGGRQCLIFERGRVLIFAAADQVPVLHSLHSSMPVTSVSLSAIENATNARPAPDRITTRQGGGE